ncbi:hypothetical protein AB3H27_25420 [Escherichia coli]|uniref:hypothetical protein n=1 Tax=Escherichia coli TaxID=562 RepID=UPI000BE22A5F|nr:hypothetical protein [Escherichia coli]EHW7392132.1 hypothetical protein [Escherichia coli]EHX1539496.1 hypothetical protein [Escherichia coli]EIP2387036.1 hypothetical protein [Escherichia coli]ELE2282780.1 hypothetical protein [Escherichia coli]MDA6547756.1 hypothetical protein [Escherichia coli]
MFISFISRQNQDLLININDISLVMKKGIFCEIYIRGVSGSVIVVDSFSTICKKIENMLPEVINTETASSSN